MADSLILSMEELRKSRPTMSDVFVSSALNNVSVAWFQTSLFAARRIFPPVPVQKEAGKFFVWDKSDFFRLQARPRAPGDEVKYGSQGLETQTFVTDAQAIGKLIPDRTRATADPGVNLERNATRWVTHQVALAEEIDWTAKFFTTALWDGASSSTDMTGLKSPLSTSTNFLRWNDIASVPIEDIEGEKESIEQQSGQPVNFFAMGRKVWTSLKNHPDVLDRIKHTQRGVVTRELFAQLIEVENVFVLSAIRDTSVEGSTSASMSFIAGNNALIGHAAPSPGLDTPTAGYTFVNTALAGATVDGVRIMQWRDENRHSDVIDGEANWDHRIVSSALGAFFSAAVSTS